uniref:Beta-galactosidase n=1 Tax=Glossina pallidipes TaxID=7398 RepID=A0A1B0A5L0_GLOPL
MAGFIAIVVIILLINLSVAEELSHRRFTIDNVTNTFLMNGEPFRYVSGSFHYFRALPEVWQKRLRVMRASGLNAVDTYIEWSLHNPQDGIYEWSGIADIETFIHLAEQEGFYIILRPGPYICAERDNGGIPYWLFSKYPNIRLRTSDPDYLYEVSIWYNKLMPRLQRYFYGNGGPIIMVQIENEYGGFHTCDRDYLRWLRDETHKYVGDQALLFTTDIPDLNIKCGKIDGVFATTDFGIDRVKEIEDIWNTLRSVQPNGPLVNSEFYPGWLTHWQEPNQRRDANAVAEALRTILTYNASVNLYMYFGGTNFGFTAGANDWGFGKYAADITSYDYDAVMDEAGGATKKFLLVRDVISEFMNVPNIEVLPSRAKAFGKVQMKPIIDLLSDEGRLLLARGSSVESIKPRTFEQLEQFSGLVLYETDLPEFEIDPTLLKVDQLRDRAYVYVDQIFLGTLSRENCIYTVPINKSIRKKLQILVENQGRINYYVANDMKGILGNVTVQKHNGQLQVLENWKHTQFPLEETQVKHLMKYVESKQRNSPGTETGSLNHGPIAYYGEFIVDDIADTYLNVRGWGKGVAYVNGFNLGRYWPLVGPQITLYVPGEILKIGSNNLILIEYQLSQKEISLDSKPQLDG